ncbi:hypothetical protein TPHA_0E01440 [Tetrapisispora phaffii CBS 4417]|uniref:Mannosyltransferase n=1 Tax=Tetrapisispora phaffii (strain ATCC 24235 / CBS 4417 / NBRC 1672 / NRRL Y-8282 / UCD 70-5) TaxID=1071381 RepID=G8BTL1_TETPH|nr:hypothetical protein TPHA_0E01440 [Tetrapisispora phaffii CBS 4417]CCE63239.1 hypothetical protein TPHA_0E01440 [Tetrapisispora phaffii CBS 4417]
MNWVYVSLIFLTIIISIQPSYIHPDEQFQSLQMLSYIFNKEKYLNLNVKKIIPWEFENQNSARSYFPLYVVYAPIYKFIKIFNITDSLEIFQLVRFYNLIIFLISCKITIVTIKKRLDDKTEQIDVHLFWMLILTSYVTTSFQSHTFSNSIETIILQLHLSILQTLIPRNQRDLSNKYKFALSLLHGTLISFGIFNRMTYPAFIFFPLIYMFFKYYTKSANNMLQLISTIFSFLITSAVIISIDSRLYESDSYVITPLNNLLYNLDKKNLLKHGLHARYTHIIINLPQMLGPMIYVLFKLKKQKINLLSLSILSGLTCLSLFEHQELRFLIPLYSIFCLYIVTNCNLKAIPNYKVVVKIWIIYNVIMTIVLGLLHQSGVLLSIQFLNKYYKQNITANIWWKTYSPPTWFYNDAHIVNSSTNIENGIEYNSAIDFELRKHHVIDLKGCSIELFNDTLHKLLTNQGDKNTTIQVVIPNSVKHRVEKISNNYNITQVYHTWFHLDLDHFDIEHPSSFYPGIGVYDFSL